MAAPAASPLLAVLHSNPSLQDAEGTKDSVALVVVVVVDAFVQRIENGDDGAVKGTKGSRCYYCFLSRSLPATYGEASALLAAAADAAVVLEEGSGESESCCLDGASRLSSSPSLKQKMSVAAEDDDVGAYHYWRSLLSCEQHYCEDRLMWAAEAAFIWMRMCGDVC